MRAHHDTRIAAKAAFASKLRAATIVAATMLLAASAISPARANPVSDFRDEVLTLIFRLAVEPAVDAFSGTDLGATTDQLGQDAFDGFFDTFNYFYDGDFTTYFADVLDVPDVTGDSISIEAGDTAIPLSDHEVSGSGNLDVSGSLFISRLKIEPGTPAFFLRPLAPTLTIRVDPFFGGPEVVDGTINNNLGSLLHIQFNTEITFDHGALFNNGTLADPHLTSTILNESVLRFRTSLL